MERDYSDLDFSRSQNAYDMDWMSSRVPVNHQIVPSSTSSATSLDYRHSLGLSTTDSSSTWYESSPGSALSDPSNLGITLSDSMDPYLTSYPFQDEPTATPWWPDSEYDATYNNSTTPCVPFFSWSGILDDLDFNPWSLDSKAATCDQPMETTSGMIIHDIYNSNNQTAEGLAELGDYPNSTVEPMISNDSRGQSTNNVTVRRGTETRTINDGLRHKLPDRRRTATFSNSVKGVTVQSSTLKGSQCRETRHRATSATQHNDSASEDPIRKRYLVPKRIEAKPKTAELSSLVEARDQQSDPVTTEQPHVREHRAAKDDFLVRSKQAGMSYKDIKRQGRFAEPVSTLRGRYRTLTKEKKDRVRKPEWEENDIRLLRTAIRKFSEGKDQSRLKIPWKQVADYIAAHGGSYHFGNATCRKRWDELQMEAEL